MKFNIFFIATIWFFKRETLASRFINHSHLNLISLSSGFLPQVEFSVIFSYYILVIGQRFRWKCISQVFQRFCLLFWLICRKYHQHTMKMVCLGNGRSYWGNNIWDWVLHALSVLSPWLPCHWAKKYGRHACILKMMNCSVKWKSFHSDKSSSSLCSVK